MKSIVCVHSDMEMIWVFSVSFSYNLSKSLEIYSNLLLLFALQEYLYFDLRHLLPAVLQTVPEPKELSGVFMGLRSIKFKKFLFLSHFVLFFHRNRMISKSDWLHSWKINASTAIKTNKKKTPLVWLVFESSPRMRF